MTPPSRISRLRALPLAALMAAVFSPALLAETATMRDWTDAKGRTLSAAYVKQDPQTVWLKRADGREFSIPKNTLSDNDQTYLSFVTENSGTSASPSADAGAAPKPAAAGGAKTSAAGSFANAKIDPTQFKPKEGGMDLDGYVLPNTLETPHFIIAGTEKIKPPMLAVYSEVAERLWSDMAADLPMMSGVKEKMLLVLLANDEDGKQAESWHVRYAKKQEHEYISHDPNMGKLTMSGFSLSRDFASEHSLGTHVRTFRVDAKGSENMKKTWEQRIHFLAGDMLYLVTNNASDTHEYSFNLVNLCMSYDREYSICGKIATEVSFSSGGDVEGFKNGKGWAAATKKLIAKGAKPDLETFLKADVVEAQPRDLGFGLGLVQFVRKDPARLAGLNTILTTIAENKKAVEPKEFATSLGFDSPEALNAAWLKFMESDAFL